MSEIPLSVKYRPKKLADVIGQPVPVQSITNAFKSGRLHHAYIFAGNLGCGKCVHGNTIISTSSGLKRINEIVPNHPGIHAINVQVLSKDGHYNQSSYGYCEKNAETLKIETTNGFRIEVTPEHPLLIMSRDASLKWVQARDLSTQDYVAIYRREQHYNKVIRSIDWKFDINSYLNKRIGPDTSNVTCLICGKSLGNLSAHFKTHGITGEEYRKKFPEAQLTSNRQLRSQCSCRLVDVTIPRRWNKSLAKIAGYVISEGGISNHQVFFTNSDTEILEDFAQSFRSCFKRDIRWERDKRRKSTFSLISSYIKIAEFFRFLELGHNSQKKKVPSCILEMNRELQAHFLSAYFEGDGGVEENCITASSKSLHLLSDVQSMLLSFGIMSNIRAVQKICTNCKKQVKKTYYVLAIYGLEIKKFEKSIGFISSTKKGRLHQLSLRISKTKRNPNQDVIPFVQDRYYSLKKKLPISKNGRLMIGGKNCGIYRWPANVRSDYPQHACVTYKNINECKSYFESISSHIDESFPHLHEEIITSIGQITDLEKKQYFFSPIKKISQSRADVYDICVNNGDHSFVGNGFVNHNTSMSRILAAMENCEQGPTLEPCGVCDNCRQIFSGKSQDVLEMDAASNRSIDDIRELKKEIRYAPVTGHMKIVIIDECLHKSTCIDTDIGRIPVGVIVNNKLTPKVKSFNHKTGEIEYKKISGWFKNSGKEIFKVRFEGKGTVYVSDGHLFATPRGYKPLRELSKNDLVLRSGKSFSDPQTDVSEEAITCIKRLGYHSVTYDLEIEDNHNYFCSDTLLHNCHSLTGHAAEALLKAIEEPPPKVLFLLCTTDPHLLKDTIHSRCQIFKFNKVSWSELSTHLENVCKKEGFEYEAEALQMCARTAEGSVRDALQNLQSVANFTGGDKITKDAAKQALGIIDDSLFFHLIDAIHTVNAPRAMQVISALFKDGKAANEVTDGLLRHLRYLLRSLTCKQELAEFGLTEDAVKRYNYQASLLKIPMLLEMISLLNETNLGLSLNLDPQILIEKYVIESIIVVKTQNA